MGSFPSTLPHNRLHDKQETLPDHDAVPQRSIWGYHGSNRYDRVVDRDQRASRMGSRFFAGGRGRGRDTRPPLPHQLPRLLQPPPRDISPERIAVEREDSRERRTLAYQLAAENEAEKPKRMSLLRAKREKIEREQDDCEREAEILYELARKSAEQSKRGKNGRQGRSRGSRSGVVLTLRRTWSNEINGVDMSNTQLVVLQDAILPATTSQTRECTVCTSKLPLISFPADAVTSDCTHTPTTCWCCIRKWLRSSLQTKGWNQLTCPECSAQLQHADVKRCADKETFESYDQLATKATLDRTRGFRWCLVRRSGKGKQLAGGCGSGQIHGTVAKMKCVGCGTVQCAYHGVLWHEGDTCKE
ncbi:unnamed protein product [Periconia digitata]|uniref:RING-type domain-containing protein n=1 Tax=Periconia digitata TaxID=1303443 RepID=A0A9W4UJU3_9PLEO|nr:unnamed protein product [Periconia digitata]